ncbi:hypothetical protein PtA15_1A528 [Puccinia triticina]|uniref:Uncharacterized protein n=1 Tax=Puccinia triticina TaxID=208348 RepID=A0ABY7C926_9BASI|nr:uncharacterized protein PtA15_1A528 [Puccinia triticina]WAQ81189.1 hypothetical protein PtA15_1A528 [Puccinia triticina]WAR52087.1 hypothetical protein PtB15_1B526 [Puccinia triticina]
MLIWFTPASLLTIVPPFLRPRKATRAIENWHSNRAQPVGPLKRSHSNCAKPVCLKYVALV